MKLSWTIRVITYPLESRSPLLFPRSRTSKIWTSLFVISMITSLWKRVTLLDWPTWPTWGCLDRGRTISTFKQISLNLWIARWKRPNKPKKLFSFWNCVGWLNSQTANAERSVDHLTIFFLKLRWLDYFATRRTAKCEFEASRKIVQRTVLFLLIK